MAYTITYNNGNTTYNLSNSSAAFPVHYLGDENFGMAPLHMITSRSPVQHGDTTLDFRLDPRIIQIPLLVECETLQEQYDQRNYLLQMFKPSNVDGNIIVEYPDGRQRWITTRVLGGLDFNMETSAGYSIRAVVKLRCSDPTWYDPTQQAVQIVSGIDGTPTPYPYIIPVTYGSALTQTISISYNGTWLSYPIIEATGPITGFSITNNSTGDIISLSSAIPAGSTYRFNLLYGYKTVTDQTGANKIATITSDSDLATFSIEADPVVPGGINSISVTGTGGTAASQVSLYYYTRYHGI